MPQEPDLSKIKTWTERETGEWIEKRVEGWTDTETDRERGGRMGEQSQIYRTLLR